MVRLSSIVPALGFCVPEIFAQNVTSSPTVTIANGTYRGVYTPSYNQDYFLGIPFAQPPLGALRFANPVPLNTTWRGERNATAYYPECVGYGGDQVGYEVDEDCLALNIIRPAGGLTGLAVAVWIHGGGFSMGGTPDLRYNLSFTVANSVQLGKPVIGVSIPYRLSAWGFSNSQELRDEGSTNVGIRDQRLALEWIHENIEAFGGDPERVTIWGESAGAASVGIHLIAYGGRDDGLFSGAISESGSPLLLGLEQDDAVAQSAFDNITQAVSCTNGTDVLECLRSADYETLNAAINASSAYFYAPLVDGDIIQGSIYEQLQNGSFVKVPYLIGANSDEGTAFGVTGVNNDTQFEAFLNYTGAEPNSIATLEVLYPDIPAIGIPASINYRPNETFGLQFKRVSAIAGDFFFIAARRLTCEQWALFNGTAYSYRFDTIPNGIPDIIGATHFQEVAFVFNNVEGLGYAANPFEDQPESYVALSKLMSEMWISFIADGDPNNHNQTGIPIWPAYNGTDGSYAENFVFDGNATNYVEPDLFRAEGIAYMNTLWVTDFGR